MEALRARAIAERLHRHDHEEDGTPLVRHIDRVARLVPTEALPVAWLHEALEWTAATERMLLTEGLTVEELRALRLLNRRSGSRSSRIYLAHLELIVACIHTSAATAGRHPTREDSDYCSNGPMRMMPTASPSPETWP